MSAPVRSRERILCVDDEPNVLDALQLQLERRYDVHTATGGEQGLACLRESGPFAVVISDMRMPHMKGSEFLARVRELAPGTVRMLLTGQTDLDSAVQAVNDGQLFRFLTKPCPPQSLLAAVEAAMAQHRLLTAEREVLEHTLMGSVQVLNEVLGLAHPEAFGRATRIRQWAAALARAVRSERSWEIETAAMLSQLGCVTVDRDLLVRAHSGQTLSAEDSRALAQVPEVSARLVAHIPRLENVRAILELLAHPGGGAPSTPPDLRRAGEILRIAVDFDWHEGRSASAASALKALRDSGHHEAALLLAFENVLHSPTDSDVVRPVSLGELREGMVLDEDVRTQAGVLFAARGYVVTGAFVERLRQSKSAGIPGSLRCLVPVERAEGDQPGRAA